MRGAGGNVSELFVSFQGEGLYAGSRHLFVRLGGCPLRCRYCDQPESLVPVAGCRVTTADGERVVPNPLTPDGLESLVGELVAQAPPLHALALTGGEPLMQVDFLEAWLPRRDARLPLLLETAGIMPERLARVLPHVAILSMDVKCPSNTGEKARWDEHEACLAAAIAARREVYVKMPVDEGTLPDEVARGARMVTAIAPRAPLFLTPLTPPDGAQPTVSVGTLERLHALASTEHAAVRVLPQLHKLLGIR